MPERPHPRDSGCRSANSDHEHHGLPGQFRHGRVGVSWSHLPSTGGQIFINTAPLESEYDVTWNQKGKQGSRSEEIFINGDIVEIVTVNLYNAKDPKNITLEQRVIGDGNNVGEILPC